jgi:hypothetical protein
MEELSERLDDSHLSYISQTFRGQDMVKKRPGRNLFAIDYASIDSTLTEANRILLDRRDVLMTDFGLLPESLQTTPDIDVAQDFAKKINELLDEAKRARLDDGRPFTEASKTVKGFFDRIDGPLKAILAELTSRITDAAKRQQRLAALEAANNATVSPAPAAITAYTGKPIATVVSIQSGTPSVPALEWVVEDFDRQNLDLDALRPYLTDAAILAACRKHLEAHGPNKLRGVMYDQRAVAG